MINLPAQFAGFKRQRNGLYMPPGVMPFIGLGGACCDNNPDGVCCAPDGTCSITKESECVAPSTWSEGGTCDPNPCPQPPAPTGRCCVVAVCSITTESECDDLGGVWTEGGNCDPNPCSEDGNCSTCEAATNIMHSTIPGGGWNWVSPWSVRCGYGINGEINLGVGQSGNCSWCSSNLICQYDTPYVEICFYYGCEISYNGTTKIWSARVGIYYIHGDIPYQICGSHAGIGASCLGNISDGLVRVLLAWATYQSSVMDDCMNGGDPITLNLTGSGLRYPYDVIDGSAPASITIY